jgi:hypothetical protein
VIIDCPKCNTYVEVREAGSYGYNAGDGYPSGKYILVACGKCDRPIVLCQENVGNMADGDIWDTPVRVFPSDTIFVNPVWPEEIKEAFEEAKGCFKSRAYTATVIMCRKIIEGLCVLNGSSERNLNKALLKLRDSGVIDSRLYDWADALRVSGNEAAHDLSVTFSKEDASDIIDLTSAILEYIYSFTNKFAEFKARRKGP